MVLLNRKPVRRLIRFRIAVAAIAAFDMIGLNLENIFTDVADGLS